jgi:signal transduction histidine kinase
MTARPTPATTPDAPLLRRTRRRLVLWSAASTLLVLVALGSLLYLVVARQLATDSEAQLRHRASIMASVSERRPNILSSGAVIRTDAAGPPTGASVMPLSIAFTMDAGAPGMVFGGSTSGTIAMPFPAPRSTAAERVLDQVGFDAAIAGTETMRETILADVPVRVYSMPVDAEGAPAGVIQVVADRTAELRTLHTTLVVLVVGGLAVVVVAAAFGWLYAGRALVPIRESSRRQREFAADASHELRTPLAVIRSNVELLRATSAAADPEAREAVDDIDAEARRMASLVDQLLLLARADSDAIELERVSCDLAEEAGDAFEAFLPVASDHGVRLELDVAEATVHGDPSRLRQLVAILVDNAVRHTPPDGTVRVDVRRDGDRARLVVEDDGPGIRSDDLPRVFDRFWRAADAPDGGSGLGLAIAAWIAQRHAGSIRAENRAPGHGARFVVELPAG